MSSLGAAQTKTVALTIDDLPYATMKGNPEDVAIARGDIAKILAVIKVHKAPMVAFVNEAKLQVPGQIDARVSLLDQWLDGGVVLGNHTYSHMNINKTPLPEFEAEVIRGEVVTRRLMKARGLELKYFRHPFLNTGATVEDKNTFEAFLKRHGYIVAPVTVENHDWAFNTAYLYTLDQGDMVTANKILDAYVAYQDVQIDYYEAMSQKLFGRNIAHVMLLHSDRLNALRLDDILKKFEARGYKFVMLEEALKDPAYQTPDNYAGPYGYPWQHRWAITLGKDADFKGAPDPPKWVLEIYNKATAAKY
ncbi:MAG TPA: polysaccharide deacetylase family protein [Terriglobales bacterium]|nr:polysaccharide deacetylase family protein [Terriglobales bacterium]